MTIATAKTQQETALRWLFSNKRICIAAVHTHECPSWRYGKKRGPCNCEAEGIESLIEKLRRSYGKE